MISKRIGNLEFGEASYLCGKPEKPNWEIRLWKPNPNFGKEKDYIKLNDEFYCEPTNTAIRKHKSCFIYKEYNIQIASFEYKENMNFYQFKYCYDRPLELNEEEQKIFFDLIKYGFEQCKEELKERDNEE